MPPASEGHCRIGEDVLRAPDCSGLAKWGSFPTLSPFREAQSLPSYPSRLQEGRESELTPAEGFRSQRVVLFEPHNLVRR